jgi:serine protease Do
MSNAGIGAPGASALSEELAAVAERLAASVVQIRAGRGGIGSGVIWESPAAGAGAEAGQPEVTIITNEHVVRASGENGLAVLVHDGRTLPVEVIGHDPEHDLALLRARASGLRAAEVGDSSALRVGDLVIAVGNPFGRRNTLTAGIVAARAPVDPEWPLDPAQPDAQPDATPAQPERAPARRAEEGPRERAARTPDLIQADVRLYPGNSGGPLADARGRVVGINSMVGGGLAFAIPSNIVRQFVAMAGTNSDERPHLGAQVLTVELTPAMRVQAQIAAPSAVLVAGVEPDSPGAEVGLLVGDLIVGIDGRAVASARELVLALRLGDAGAVRTLIIVRGGQRRELVFTPRPLTEAAA